MNKTYADANRGNYINRTIEKLISKMSKNFAIILINGPRQIGKSTVLHYYTRISKKEISYISFDNYRERIFAKKDPEMFIKNHNTPLIIDEFQYVPEILSYIKIKVDKYKQDNLFSRKNNETIYFLTGSQIFQSMKNISESLAGRVGIIDLYGLSSREILGLEEIPFIPDINLLKQKNIQKIDSETKLFKKIFMGSFPEVHANNLQGNILEEYYATYLRTYLERDIRTLINIKDEEKFLKFISSVAARTAQEYNASEIGKDIGIDSKTVDNWISILKNTGLIYFLQPYSNNNLKKAIKRPKMYFMDTGLASYLTGHLNSEMLQNGYFNGAIFETYVVTEIIKSYSNNGLDPRRYLYYYRDTNKKEIDLIIINNGKAYPIEIKKNSNPQIKASKNFDIVKNFNIPSGEGIILCTSRNIMQISENIYQVPIEYI